MQETLLALPLGLKNQNAPRIMNDNLFSVNDSTKHIQYIANNIDKRNNKLKKQDNKYHDLKSEVASKRQSKNILKKMKSLEEENSPKNGLKKPFVNYCSESPRIWKEEKNKFEREIDDFQMKTSEDLFSQSHLNDLHNFGTSGKSNLGPDDFPVESKNGKSGKVNNSGVDENYNMTEYLKKIKEIYAQKEEINYKLYYKEQSESHNPSNYPLKKYPLLLNDECRCINPGISHACLSRMSNDDSFGILNPMFAETDPGNSPKISQKRNGKARSKTRGLQRAQSSSLSDTSKVSSFHSLDEFRQSSLVESNSTSSSSNCIRATRSKTYSDFFSALSLVNPDLNYSYFYPNDMREEIMFPLPDSLQKGVFRNPNAKEASFSIRTPQKKKRVKPLKILIPEIDEQELLKDIDALNALQNSVPIQESLKVSEVSPPVSLKSLKSGGIESQSSFESQEFEDGDNFGRQEYLEYKASSDSSRRNSDFSSHSGEQKESRASNTNENFPYDGSSSFASPEALHRPLADSDLEISLRKLSLPCVPQANTFDISSIYVEDLQSSLNQIYQPLPTEIFGFREKVNSNKSSITEDVDHNLIDLKNSPEPQMEKRMEENIQKVKETDYSTQLTNANPNQSYSSMKADKNFPITDIQDSGLSSEISISPTILPSNFGKSIYSTPEEKPILDEVSDNKESANSLSTSFIGNEIQKINSFEGREENIQTGARRKRREGVSAPPNTFPALDLDFIPDQPSSLASGNYSKLSSSSSSEKSSPRSPLALVLQSLSSSVSSIASTSSSSSSSSSSSCSWSGSSSESSSSSDCEDMLL